MVDLPEKKGIKAGVLVPIHLSTELPFVPARVFWVTCWTDGTVRGNHANRKCREVIFCLEGRVAIRTEDVRGNTFDAELRSTNTGLYLPTHHWIRLEAKQRCVVLVFASHDFEPKDYISDYQEFKNLR